MNRFGELVIDLADMPQALPGSYLEQLRCLKEVALLARVILEESRPLSRDVALVDKCELGQLRERFARLGLEVTTHSEQDY